MSNYEVEILAPPLTKSNNVLQNDANMDDLMSIDNSRLQVGISSSASVRISSYYLRYIYMYSQNSAQKRLCGQANKKHV